MKILDKEIDFDLTDAEVIDSITKIDNKYSKTLKETTSIVEMCNTYKNFFDEVIGEGTSKLLFGDKNNYMLITKAYNEFLIAIEEQLNEFTKEQEKIAKKYERYK